jgi:uncharacterized membrane protein YgdD (TMEM256/DUF423 family)
VWETGARYALGHAPALLAAAALQAWRPSRLGAAAGGLLLGGALVAFVLYWAAAGVLGENTQE